MLQFQVPAEITSPFIVSLGRSLLSAKTIAHCILCLNRESLRLALSSGTCYDYVVADDRWRDVGVSGSVAVI